MAAPTGSVTITGTPTQGQTLTASNNLVDTDGIISLITYQWRAGGVNIPGATSNSLTLTQAHVGAVITVVASYTDTAGTESVTSTATTAVVNINDLPTGSVTITGTPTQGQTLSVGNTLGDADGIGTISYQWRADGAPIVGATGTTLTLLRAQVGAVISVTASYVDGGGRAESVSSTPTTIVAPLNTSPTGSVSVVGTATQGQTLNASNNIVDADGIVSLISYQWKENGTPIAGATNNAIVLAQAQVGKTITVSASYLDLLGNAESLTSSATGAVSNVNDAPTGTVTISGTAAQFQTLTASNSLADADGLGTLLYQWKENGNSITGATSNSLVQSQAQVGKTITVTVTYIDGFGFSESVTSAATSVVADVNDPPVGTVTIGGTSTQGQTLTVTPSLTDADGLGAFSYQWLANGINIGGATSTTFLLTQSQVGLPITVTVSYTDGLGLPQSVTSSATTAVTNVNDAPTGSTNITGTATQGQVLTANTSTLADADGLGTLTYQWRANGVIISSATAPTFTLTQAEVGKAVSVVVNYTDGQGTAETLTSPATSFVVNVNDPPIGLVTITGTASMGQTLTASNNLADADGLGTITYQWKADGADIAGATAATLLLGAPQAGKLITVAASYTDVLGSAESVLSAATAAVTQANTAPTGLVAISGTPAQGQTLTATNSLADADGLGPITYQWKADGSPIAGATGATVILGQAQVGKSITVTASYTDLRSTVETVTSTATSAVTNINDPPVGSISITGTPKQGFTLGVGGSLADADGLGTLSYQWKANGVDISGATSSTFTPGVQQVGRTLSVTVRYTDGFGASESISSPVTAPIAIGNGIPVISGVNRSAQNVTVGEGHALNALAVSDPDGATVPLTLTLSATNGTFSVVDNPGSKFPALQLSGTAAIINSTLKLLNFTATSVGIASISAGLSDGDVGSPATATLQFKTSNNAMPGLTRPDGSGPVIGDGNGDGAADVLQTAVSSVLMARSATPSNSATAPTTYVTLVAASQAGKVDPGVVAPNIHGVIQMDINGKIPTGAVTPLGQISFTSDMRRAGQSESFSIYVDANLGINGLWRQDPAGFWTNLASATNGGGMSLEGGKLRLDFKLTEGSSMDMDGAQNGVIVGGVVPAFMPLTLVGQAPVIPGNTFGF